MSVSILDDGMSSDRTPHTARLVPGDRRSWEVSWLPGRQVDRNSAITAMILADTVGTDGMRAGLGPHIEGWADELTLTVPEALAQMASPPCWQDAARTGALEDPEAAE
jgi:hypothetical protein